MHAVRASVAYDGERFHEGGATVLVEGARIVGVEPAGFEVPAGIAVTTYDGTLLPGLVDAHVHLVSDASPGGLERAGSLTGEELDALVRQALAQQAAAGVTTVRDLGDAGFCTLPHREARRDGEPRLVVAGPPITVAGGHCHYLGGAVSGAEQIRSAVAARARRGVDVVKVMATGGMMTPGTDLLATPFADGDLRLLVEEAHDAGLPVVAHAHSLAGARQSVRAGVDGIEHFTCLTERGVEYPDDLLAEVAARGATTDLTLGIDRSVTARMGTPPPGVQALLDRFGLTLDQLRDLQVGAVEPVRRHGITMIAGVDAGATPPKLHGNAWIVVTDLVEGGCPLEEALAAATSVAARECGVGTVTGSLREGYDADLLVIPGDLRADHSALGRPLAVWVRGVPVPPRQSEGITGAAGRAAPGQSAPGESCS